MNPIDGDLKGYFSGRSTRTFHTPPSYGAKWWWWEKEKNENMRINRIVHFTGERKQWFIDWWFFESCDGVERWEKRSSTGLSYVTPFVSSSSKTPRPSKSITFVLSNECAIILGINTIFIFKSLFKDAIVIGTWLFAQWVYIWKLIMMARQAQGRL